MASIGQVAFQQHNRHFIAQFHFHGVLECERSSLVSRRDYLSNDLRIVTFVVRYVRGLAESHCRAPGTFDSVEDQKVFAGSGSGESPAGEVHGFPVAHRFNLERYGLILDGITGIAFHIKVNADGLGVDVADERLELCSIYFISVLLTKSYANYLIVTYPDRTNVWRNRKRRRRFCCIL